MAKKSKAGMPSNIENEQGLATNNISSTPDTTHRSGKIEDKAWWNDPDVDKRIDDYVKQEGNNEPLSGSQGIVSKGNQGDNAIANPDAPDTADITKEHQEELAQLQNEAGDTNVATGTILGKGEKTKPSEESLEVKSTNQLGKEVKPTLEDLKFAQQYYDDYRLPKNGADYLRQLWGQGAAGKAKAAGNVIGNLLGKTGTINVAGAQGQGRDFTSDWENYVNNYQKEMADRNARIFNDNMDIVKQASTNAQARKDLVAQLELALKNAGKLDANAMRLLQIWSTATAPSSALDRGISALMTLIPEGVFK